MQNFTALIPGTTVEILDQDSKNIIQLIVNAYNVSKGGFSSIWSTDCVCFRRKESLSCPLLKRMLVENILKLREKDRYSLNLSFFPFVPY